MRVNLNIPVIGLDGREIYGSNLGQIFATVLANANQINAGFSIPLAVEFYRGGIVEIDDDEREFLIQFVTNNHQLSSLIEYRILENLQ